MIDSTHQNGMDSALHLLSRRHLRAVFLAAGFIAHIIDAQKHCEANSHHTTHHEVADVYSLLEITVLAFLTRLQNVELSQTP